MVSVRLVPESRPNEVVNIGASRCPEPLAIDPNIGSCSPPPAWIICDELHLDKGQLLFCGDQVCQSVCYPTPADTLSWRHPKSGMPSCWRRGNPTSQLCRRPSPRGSCQCSDPEILHLEGQTVRRMQSQSQSDTEDTLRETLGFVSQWKQDKTAVQKEYVNCIPNPAGCVHAVQKECVKCIPKTQQTRQLK